MKAAPSTFAVVTLLATMAPPARATNSGVPRPSYQLILHEMSALAHQDPAWVKTFDYGQSEGGHTLRAIKLQDPVARAAAGPHPTVLITGNTHGDEYLHIEDRLAPWLLANRATSPGVQRFFAAGGVVLLVPVVNPDGFSIGVRENGRGADLNRDFDQLPLVQSNFREAESRLLAQWLERELQVANLWLKVTVDYHCCSGSLLFPWSYSGEVALAAADREAFAAIGRAMQAKIDRGYRFGATSEILGYSAEGTSKDYFFAKYHALAFTFEGRRVEEAEKFLQHAAWWDEVLGRLAGP